MKPYFHLLLLTILVLIPHSQDAMELSTLDSAKPGTILIALVTEGDAGDATLRHLQLGNPERERLELARSRPDPQPADKREGWESAADSAALESRFQEAHHLILRGDMEACSFDKHFRGDTVRGKWGHLELLPAKTTGTDVDCAPPLTWNGRPLGKARVEDSNLRGSPIIEPVESPAYPVIVWARFERNGACVKKGELPLKATPAVISGNHGKGKVMPSITRCERPPSSSNIFPTKGRWCAPCVSGDAE